MMVYLVIPVLLAAAELFIRKKISGRPEAYAGKTAVRGHVVIRPAKNSGFAGSCLTNRTRLVKISSAVSLAAWLLLYPFFLLTEGGRLLKAGISLILGGAAGNTFERLRYGYVTDYLQVNGKKGKKGWIWNLADLAILAGTILTICGVLKKNS